MASRWSQDVYIKAYRFAAEAHWNRSKKQHVPGTDIPYLMHFSMVAMEVIPALEKETGLNGNLAVQCALLHDTIEDTDTTPMMTWSNHSGPWLQTASSLSPRMTRLARISPTINAKRARWRTALRESKNNQRRSGS